MDLHIWPGKANVDTFDSDCLVVLTYLRLGNCPINLCPVDVSVESNLKNIPFLNHGKNKITGLTHIIEYLRKENYGLEYDLSDDDLVNLDALVASIERRITPATRWLLWNDYHVFNTYTGQLYRSSLTWFSAFWSLGRWRKEIKKGAEFSQITHCTGSYRKDRDADIEVSLYEGARRCLTALSYILGSKKFFLGDRPTAVDAYLFGRLWPLLNYDRLRNCSKDAPHHLIAHLYQCSNIFKHCQRILTICFPLGISSIRTAQNSPSPSNESSSGYRLFHTWLASSDVSHPLRDGLFFGFLFLTITSLFAVRSGLVRFSTANEDQVDVPDSVVDTVTSEADLS